MRWSRATLAVAALTVLAALLRFSTIDVQSFWIDEAFTAYQLDRLGLSQLLSNIDLLQTTPPLYYVLADGWSELFGVGETGLRSLSGLLGVATVPISYLTAGAFLSERAGLITAALVATSPIMVWYSQEARPYALLVLLGTLSLLALAAALKRPGARWPLVFGLASALSIGTHYFAAFLVVPAAVLLVARRRDRWSAAALAFPLLAGLLLLPLALAQRARGGGAPIGQLPLDERVGKVAVQFLSGPNTAPGRGLGALAAVGLIGGVALLVLRGSSKERRRTLIPLVLGGLALGTPILMSAAGEEYVLDRNVLAAWIPLAMVPAAGLAARRSGKAGTAAAAVACLAFALIALAVPFNPSYTRDDWRGAVRSVSGSPGPRALVVRPTFSRPAVEIYEPAGTPMPIVTPVPVRSIILIGTGPDPPPPAASSDGRGRLAPFRLQGIENFQKLGVHRLEAARAVSLSAADLVRAGLARHPGSIVLSP